MKIYPFYLVISLITLTCLSSCGDTATPKNNKAQIQQNFNLSDTEVQSIINGYLEIKNALVHSDQSAAASAAGSVLPILAADNMSNSMIRSSVKKIANATNIEEQRNQFEQLSMEVYEMVASTGANSSTLYKQYCPMAFDNKGAFWLSAEKQVNNPYFGDKMLHCGKVEATIEPK